MPTYDRSAAKESGFDQIRASMLAFEGDVVEAVDGTWGHQPDEPAKEFFEIKCMNVKILEVKEDLTFVPTEWGFRINMSDFKGSFWIDEFLRSADEAKILLPNGLIGKRIEFRKKDMPYKYKDKETKEEKEGVKTDWIIARVIGDSSSVPAEAASTPAAAPLDLTATALEMAVGKTETQFRSAIGIHPSFLGTPLLALAKTGGFTQSMIQEGKLKLVDEKGQKVYRKP
jgi:hypothetical protein